MLVKAKETVVGAVFVSCVCVGLDIMRSRVECLGDGWYGVSV